MNEEKGAAGRLVELKNGSKEDGRAVEVFVNKLANLQVKNFEAFRYLVSLCRKETLHIRSGYIKELLAREGFLYPDGGVNQVARNVVLSAVQGSHDEMRLMNPIKPLSIPNVDFPESLARYAVVTPKPLVTEAKRPLGPRQYDRGYQLAVNTARGLFGLRVNGAGSQIHLIHPFEAGSLPVEAVADMLGLAPSRPVSWGPHWLADEGKVAAWELRHLGRDSMFATQIQVAYEKPTFNQWGNLFSPECLAGGGRIWANCQPGIDRFLRFEYFNSMGDLRLVEYGRRLIYAIDDTKDMIVPDQQATKGRAQTKEVVPAGSIYTIEGTYLNRYTPDGPVDNPEIILGLMPRFFKLFCELVKACGGGRNLTISLGQELELDDLARFSRTRTQQIRVGREVYYGLRADASKQAKDWVMLWNESKSFKKRWLTLRYREYDQLTPELITESLFI